MSPNPFLIFAAVLGSISRLGSVVKRSPTHTVACPPFPLLLLTRKANPCAFASSLSSAMKRSLLSIGFSALTKTISDIFVRMSIAFGYFCPNFSTDRAGR